MLEPQQMKQVGIVVLGLAFVLWCWRSTRHAEEELLSPGSSCSTTTRARQRRARNKVCTVLVWHACTSSPLHVVLHVGVACGCVQRRHDDCSVVGKALPGVKVFILRFHLARMVLHTRAPTGTEEFGSYSFQNDHVFPPFRFQFGWETSTTQNGTKTMQNFLHPEISKGNIAVHVGTRNGGVFFNAHPHNVGFANCSSIDL